MRINQNISAMNTHASMIKADNSISKSLERLSSGLRINRSADDAAGLAISEKMRGQISGLNQASRNAQDGISLLQTAEGALNETHSILQRMRELSVQAANDTLTGSDRAEIQKEMDQLTKETDRIAKSTEFNTKSLLRGLAGSMSVSGANMTGGSAGSPAVAAAGSITLSGDLIAAANATTASGTLTLTGVTSGDVVQVGGNTYTFGDGTGGTVDVGADDNAAAVNLAAAIQGDGLATAAQDGTTLNQINLSAASAGAAGNLTVDISGSNGHAAGVDLAGGNDAIAGDTVTIAGQVYTAGTDFAVTNGNTTATAAALAAAITGSNGITATNTNGVVNISASAAGTAGNAITIAESSANASASGATLSGGAALQAATAASGTLTISALPTVGDTVTVHGNTYTFVASGGNGSSTVDIGGSANATATSLATAIGTRDNALTANNSNGVITLTAAATGVAGNSFGLATSSTTSNTQTLTMHIGANAGQSMSISLTNMDAGSLGIGRDAGGVATVAGTDAVQGLDVTTQAAANASITTIDNAIQTVSQERSRLGAFQNRLEHTISNLGTTAENMSASESRIRDVDMAEEMANFSRSQILMQASTAMMAQANQKPQAVLKLLG